MQLLEWSIWPSVFVKRDWSDKNNSCGKWFSAAVYLSTREENLILNNPSRCPLSKSHPGLSPQYLYPSQSPFSPLDTRQLWEEQNKFSRTLRSARLAGTKWKLSEMRFSLQKGWLSLKMLVSRGLKNPLMSVNLLRCCCHAMLVPVFPWHPVLSVCIFVGTWVELLNEIFFHPSSTPGGAWGGR